MSDISYDVLCDVYSETLTGFFIFAVYGRPINEICAKSTHICGIKGCGGAGWPPPTNNFRTTSVTPTNYISSEREFIGESESSKILGKYFGFAIL